MSAKPASDRRIAGIPLPAAAWLALALLACGHKEESRPGRSPRNADGPAEAAVLRSPAATALSRQSAVALTRAVMAETVEVPFRIEPDERRTTRVIAPAAGRIEAAYIRTSEQAVRAGERLALLYSPELVAAQREYLLLDPRRDAGLVRQAEGRLLRMGLAPSQVRSLRTSGKPLERIPIASPKAGFLLTSPPSAGAMGATGNPSGEAGLGAGMGGMSGGRMSEGMSSGGMPSAGEGRTALRAGAMVTRRTVLAEVNDLEVVVAVLTVPVRNLDRIREGDSVHLSLDAAGSAVLAKVGFLDARVADTSGNVEVRAYLSNPGHRLKLGSLGRGQLATRPETAWVLPRTAVHDLGERHIAWVRDTADTGVFEAREVRVGRKGERLVEVLAGLSPGALVAEHASLLLDPDVVAEPRPLQGAPSGESHAGHAAAPESDAVHRQAEGGHAHPPAAGHGAHAATEGNLEVPADQALRAGIRTAAAAASHLAPTRVFRGVTQFDARSREDIPARAEGRIDEVPALRVGERVSRGQILATLQSEPLQAAQEEFLAARKAAAALANPELVRAQVGAARRRLQVLGMTDLQVANLERRGGPFPRQPIVSPREGILLEVSVRPGQYVSDGTPLFTVGLSDRIWVETWMLAAEAARFPEGTEARVRVEGIPGEEARGRLVHVRQGTTLSGSVTPAHIGLSRPDPRILPGMQAWVTFQLPGRHVLGVPPSALLRSSSSTMAWVKVGPEAYAPRMVKTGVETPDAVEVLEGIRNGEEVVVSGAYLLGSEWTIRKGAGKVHASH